MTLPTFVTLECESPHCQSEVHLQEQAVEHRRATYGGVHCQPCIARTNGSNPLKR